MPAQLNYTLPAFGNPPPMVVPSQNTNPAPSTTMKASNAGTPAKTPTKTPAKSSNKRAAGKGSKSGEGNWHDIGDLDEEITKLSRSQMDVAAVKVADTTDMKPENTHGLTGKDKLAAVEYIVAPEQWKEFWLMQSTYFIHVCASSFLLQDTQTKCPSRLQIPSSKGVLW
jgi:hypothetical protein